MHKLLSVVMYSPYITRKTSFIKEEQTLPVIANSIIFLHQSSFVCDVIVYCCVFVTLIMYVVVLCTKCKQKW